MVVKKKKRFSYGHFLRGWSGSITSCDSWMRRTVKLDLELFWCAHWIFSTSMQCFENRTGPASSTGWTAKRPWHRSGSMLRLTLPENRSNPVKTVKPVESDWTGFQVFPYFFFFFFCKNFLLKFEHKAFANTAQIKY